MQYHLLSNIQDDIVSQLENDLGPHGLFVGRSETDDEFAHIEWAKDNMERLEKWPHCWVYTGPSRLQGEDTTRRMGQFVIPVRNFVMTRDASSQNEEAQKKLGDKWSLLVAASLQGSRFGDPDFTNQGIVQNLRIEPLGNGEDAALWEVAFDLDLNVSFDDILNSL